MMSCLYEVSKSLLHEEKVLRATVDTSEILMAQTPSGVRVYSGVCPHLGGPLLEGCLRKGKVTCPWHEYQFDLETGRCETIPGKPWRAIKEIKEPFSLKLKALPFEEVDGKIRVLG